MDDDILNIETVENEEVESNPEPREEQEYQPNWKFKVKDQEHEFDERVRSAVTSKEAEDHLRDIYTKAYGLDSVKQRAEENEQNFRRKDSEFGELRSRYDQVQNGLQKINALKSEDFGTFQKVWQIPDSQVLERASQILSLHGNPEGQAAADKVYNDRIQMLQYQDRVAQESQTSQVMQRQLHEMKMTSALTNPDVSRFAQEYDKRVGQPGSFQEEVNRLGTLEHHQGRYLDPQVAVAQVHQKLSKLLGTLTPSQPQAQSPVVNDPARVQPLPNMGSGRAGAPVKKKLSTTDDLRKLAASMRR